MMTSVISKKRLLGAGLLLWMAVIFAFSSLHGSGSSYVSPLWYVLERKGAHVIEFFILAFLAALFFLTYPSLRKEKKAFPWFVFLFCTAYALSDEIHQFFVFGREARFTDVLIDTGGVILGMTLFFFWQQKQWRKYFLRKLFKRKTSR